MYNKMSFDSTQRGASMPAQHVSNNYPSNQFNTIVNSPQAKKQVTMSPSSPIHMHRRATSHANVNNLDMTLQAQSIKLQSIDAMTPARRQSAHKASNRKAAEFMKQSKSANRGIRTMSTMETNRAGGHCDSTEYTYRRTGLSVGLVAGTKRDKPFGTEFYRSPIADDTFYRISVGNAENKEKRKNFADLEAKRLNYIPGPKYMQHSDWRENIKGRTGKFLGAKRKTFTDEVMEYEHKLPAPSKFDNKEALKKLIKTPGNYTFKDNRVHFTEHKKWLAGQVPPAKYVITNVKCTKPKLYAAHIVRPEPKSGSTWVIPKQDGPGPGSYKVEESIKFQWGKVRGQSKQTWEPPTFTDRAKNMLKHVPGSGHYKQLEAAKDKVCKDKSFMFKRQ